MSDQPKSPETMAMEFVDSLAEQPVQNVRDDLPEIVLPEDHETVVEDERAPPHELSQIIREERFNNAVGDKTGVATLLMLRYSDQVQQLEQDAKLYLSLVLHVGETLGVTLEITKYTYNPYERVVYNKRVTPDATYDRQEMQQVAFRIKGKIAEHSKMVADVKSTVSNLENKIAELQKDIRNKNEYIRVLTDKVKYHTIEEKPFVLAYLGNKGDYVYLGNRNGGDPNKPAKMGRTKDFSHAYKYANPQEALVQLITLLKDRNNVVPSAPKFNVLGAHLIPAVIDIVPGNIDLEKLRKEAEQYEAVMLVAKKEKQRGEKKAKRLEEKRALKASAAKAKKSGKKARRRDD